MAQEIAKIEESIKKLQIKLIHIDEIKEYSGNPRNIDNAAVKAVMHSIQEFGWKIPIVLDSNNELVCGHTRIRAARRLGLTTVPYLLADDLDAEQIKMFRIIDNRTSEKATWDYSKLQVEFQSLDLELPVFQANFSEFEVATIMDHTWTPAEQTEKKSSKSGNCVTTTGSFSFDVTEEQREILLEAINKIKPRATDQSPAGCLTKIISEWLEVNDEP